MTDDVSMNPEHAQRLLQLTRDARSALEEALRQLDSARNWGIWDILGGGFISNLVKHSRVDNAKEYLYRAERIISQLNEELGQFGVDGYFGEYPGGFAIFADFFFDGLFSDLYMQGKIGELRDKARRVMGELWRVEQFLQQQVGL